MFKPVGYTLEMASKGGAKEIGKIGKYSGLENSVEIVELSKESLRLIGEARKLETDIPVVSCNFGNLCYNPLSVRMKIIFDDNPARYALAGAPEEYIAGVVRKSDVIKKDFPLIRSLPEKKRNKFLRKILKGEQSKEYSENMGPSFDY